MSILIKAGGGGASYLVDVKAYATEAAIPAAGVKGRLAVVTTVAIPSWVSGGIMMKATKPTTRDDGSPLQNGDICVIEGTVSNTPFDIVKGVTVYPIACFQYVSGAWAEQVAKFDNGTIWVYLYLFLYYLGDQCSSIAGGWQARAWSSDSSTPGFLPTITYGADYVNIAFTSQNQKSGVYEIINDVDLTNFTSLVFDGYGDYYAGYKFPEIAVVARGSTYYSVNAAAKSYITNLGRGTTTLNISALNGNYDVCAAVHTYTAQSTFLRMYSIKFTP